MESISAEQKALRINLDPLPYGTFAEIGAGQEIARWFFTVGGAAGTVAKTISAYDMKFSDAIYGKGERYVSRDRLKEMLIHEYDLLEERLSLERGERSAFFVVANTVSARNYKGTNECHGWVGIRLQLTPHSQPSDLIVHVRMKDRENVLQQQALGIFGVNLLYAALYLREKPEIFVHSLLDGLSVERIEVDVIDLEGHGFDEVDDRLATLQLVEHDLAPAVLLGGRQQVFQPSELLRKRPLLIMRGWFEQLATKQIEMLAIARKQLGIEVPTSSGEPLALCELSIKGADGTSLLSVEEVIRRADDLNRAGLMVLITNLPYFYQLPEYLRRFTNEKIAFVAGAPKLTSLFDPGYYSHLPGGILEAFGRLFIGDVTFYAYPVPTGRHNENSLLDIPVDEDLRFLFEHLVHSGRIVGL